MNFEILEFQPIIDKIAKQFETKARDKHLEIAVSHQEKEPILINVDIHYFTQIIENLNYPKPYN